MVQAYLFFYAMLACFVRGKRYDDPLADGEDEERTVARAVIRSIDKDNTLRIPFIDLTPDPQHVRPLLAALQSCFQIMRLQLDGEDDPQIIFETLNARGAPLQPSDLIRNFLFLRASRNGEDVTALYEAYWKDFDEKPEPGAATKGAKFWKKEERQGRLKNSRLDLLLYHYVGLRKRADLKVAHVFEEFKTWWEAANCKTDDELKRLTKLAHHFETFVAPDQKSRFGLFCRRMKLLDTATQTPLVFHLLEHHDSDSDELITAITDLESYFVRRFICGKTTKSYNRLFLGRLLAEMVAEGKADAATLRTKLLALAGDSQLWPDDAAFETSWTRRQLYQGQSTQKVRAVLEGLEFGLRTAKQEFLPELHTLSVEHVLPQDWKPNDYPLHLDTAETQENRERLLHSIGNLTLVTQGFNSSLSNKAFALKRPELAANSSLMLNAYFQQFKNTDSWDEEAIVVRAQQLFPLALKIWPHPKTGSAAASKDAAPGQNAAKAHAAAANKLKQFDEAMFTIYRRAKEEANYHATIFFRMLNERRGLATAKYLINATQPSEGYTHLYERGRLDLTVEAMVVEDRRWHELFTADELAKAAKRLKDYHYTPKFS